MPKKIKLTEKQKKFCDFYIKTNNATESAKMAGYSVKTAYSSGQRLLKNVEVKKRIEDCLKKLEDARTADAAEVLKYLTSVMRREQCENVVVTLKQEKSTYVPDDSGTMRKQTVKEEIPKIIEIPSRLSDANKAAELLGKRFGLWKDTVELTGDMTVNISLDYGNGGDENGRND